MNYINYVNIKQGTQSNSRFSNGNILPLTQMPFGMNGFAPQTASDRGAWFYHPGDRALEGVRITHQPSPWIGDYGHLVIMPQCGEVYSSPAARWSGYRPENAILTPSYMKLDFLRYNAVFELAPTERGASVRISYAGEGTPRFAVLPVQDICGYSVDIENSMLTGFTKAHTWKAADNFAMYFAIKFDCGIDLANTVLANNEGNLENNLKGEGENLGISIALTAKEVNIKIATSYISTEQAKQNLVQELGELSFNDIKNAATKKWEDYLSRIEIETTDEEQKKTFYSCFYRMFLFPRKFYEICENGDKIHFCADTGKTNPGVKYVDNGFWDTFRTVYPMFSIVAPEMYAEILEGFVNTYKDCGWLPKWPSPSEVGMMPGTLIDAVIADAAVKDIVSKEILEEAFQGMIKHATCESEDKRYGRHGTEDYNQYGYIPRNKYKESVNHTLDYVYGDFCIVQTAKVLGYNDIADKYMSRTQNYKKIFDTKTGFMRSRDTDGNMAENFDEFAWGGEYCEGGPWQNSFAVYHDLEGLAELYGGKDEFINKIDLLFETPPFYKVGGYNIEIHEMTEMAAVDFGQCAISNQPSFHIPYIFAQFGEYDKSQYWVEKIARELFSYKDDGFPGDEDNGTMAGWYVFSTIGLYPMCPGKPEYLKLKPLVDRVVIHTPTNDYVVEQSKVINTRISHDEIVRNSKDINFEDGGL
jgi:predicted alpha-1,2-mannosidase